MDRAGFTAKVIRIGNSVGVCIPSNTVKLLGIKTGDVLQLEIVLRGNENGNENTE